MSDAGEEQDDKVERKPEVDEWIAVWSPRRTPSSTRPRPRMSAGHFGGVDAAAPGWKLPEQDEGDIGANADRAGT